MPTYAEAHRRSLHEREAFWTEKAALIDWNTPFESVLDYDRPPFARWFVGGRTNLCHNAVDRHLAARGDQAALIFISTENGGCPCFIWMSRRASPVSSAYSGTSVQAVPSGLISVMPQAWITSMPYLS